MDTLGPRRGTVVNNVDPEGMGRVTVRVEGLIDDESEWALPFGVGMTASQGAWNLPAVGALVWVMFEGGDLDAPRRERAPRREKVPRRGEGGACGGEHADL